MPPLYTKLEPFSWYFHSQNVNYPCFLYAAFWIVSWEKFVFVVEENRKFVSDIEKVMLSLI